MRTTRLFAAVALSASLIAGCSDSTEGDDPEDSIFVDDSKADDFFSMSAQEYLIDGKSTVVLDAAFATRTTEERLREAKRLVGLKQIAIAWFLTQYFVDKEHED